MDFEDEWIERAWRHEAGNLAQTVYGAEDLVDMSYDSELPDIQRIGKITAEDLQELVTAVDERIPTYEGSKAERLNPESRARRLKEVTEGVLALGNGKGSVPVREVNCILERHGFQTDEPGEEVYGNQAWRLPFNTIAKNSDRHGGPESFLNEGLTDDKYFIEIFDNGELDSSVSHEEIWEEGNTSTYGGSGFGLSMAKDIISQLDGDVASYTREGGEVVFNSPLGDYEPESQVLEGVEYDDLGVGFVVEMPLYDS